MKIKRRNFGAVKYLGARDLRRTNPCSIRVSSVADFVFFRLRLCRAGFLLKRSRGRLAALACSIAAQKCAQYSLHCTPPTDPMQRIPKLYIFLSTNLLFHSRGILNLCTFRPFCSHPVLSRQRIALSLCALGLCGTLVAAPPR